MPFTGHVVSDPNREVDLEIDAAGDLLDVDDAGNVLVVTPAVLWTGASASQEQ